MSEKQAETDQANAQHEQKKKNADQVSCYYRIRFRQLGQEFTAEAEVVDLFSGTLVMVKTDHGPEPAAVIAKAANVADAPIERQASYTIIRVATAEEEEKFIRLPELENEAYGICSKLITELKLPMHLVRVERFFNGSKIIFYFTAENRVDFRELVKKLVQEFRTRVEMRQIGVRHETQMLGGLGACGRELCCTSFLKKFDSVSIKMAKTQDLPLNPAKISGVCNRLLCCLTYEYDVYDKMKKVMPKVGRSIKFEDKIYRVVRQIPLLGNLRCISQDGEERILEEEQWRKAEVMQKSGGRKGGSKKSSGPSSKKK